MAVHVSCTTRCPQLGLLQPVFQVSAREQVFSLWKTPQAVCCCLALSGELHVMALWT